MLGNKHRMVFHRRLVPVVCDNRGCQPCRDKVFGMAANGFRSFFLRVITVFLLSRKELRNFDFASLSRMSSVISFLPNDNILMPKKFFSMQIKTLDLE